MFKLHICLWSTETEYFLRNWLCIKKLFLKIHYLLSVKVCKVSFLFVFSVIPHNCIFWAYLIGEKTLYILMLQRKALHDYSRTPVIKDMLQLISVRNCCQVISSSPNLFLFPLRKKVREWRCLKRANAKRRRRHCTKLQSAPSPASIHAH